MAKKDDKDRSLTTRQGHPVTNNQSQRTVGSRGPATLENYHFLEKISHFDRERIPERVVHARGFVCYGEFEATGKIGDEPASKYTRAKLFQASRQEDAARHPLLDRHRRPRLVRGGARSARLRGQVLHRGRQLGSGRQQPAGVLHPRRDQVSRRHPLAEAGPGHLPPGAEPHLRLHEPDAGIDAHADVPVQPARHSGQLPAPGGLRRQHLQDGQRRGRDGARQVPLASALRRRQPDRRRGGQGAGQGSRLGVEGPVRGDRARRLPAVGFLRADHGRPRASRSSTGIRSTTPRSGRRTSFRCATSAS